MRVIAGSARSLRLKTPDGLSTRPTTDRIKETLFNMLGANVYDAVFIDCFSGSGAIGIEALSRGAKHAYLLENAPEAIKCIQENLKFTHLSERATVMKSDVLHALSGIHEKEADIIFMDPPYKLGIEPDVFQILSAMSYVTPDTLIITEATLDNDMMFLKDLGFQIIKEKLYKTNKHVFIKKSTKE